MELAQSIASEAEGATAAFEWLRTGEEALTRMVRELYEAKSSIRLETYIFHAGPVADQFREALVLACQRGVKVRLLIDALGSISLPTVFWDPLVKFGGQFVWFNPLSLRRWSYRDHRKMLIIDDRIAFIGGFNIADEYKGDGVNYGWRDLGLRITGPAVRELAESFDAFFARADLQPKRLQRLRKGALKVAEGNNWKLVMSGPGLRHGELRRTLGHDLSRAHSVKIICAYFLPTWRLRKELLRVCNRGGRVQLILAGKSDVAISQLASRRLYRLLMRSGLTARRRRPGSRVLMSSNPSLGQDALASR